MSALWLSLVVGAVMHPSASFQVVGWSEAGDEALIAEVQERSSTPSLCFLDVASGQSSVWLTPLANGDLSAGSPSLTCDDALASLNGELVAGGFDLAVNPGFCGGTDEPVFTNLGNLSRGADIEHPVDGSFRMGLFNLSYFEPRLDGNDLVEAPFHPSLEQLPTLGAHWSATAPHGVIVAGGPGRTHVVDLFYSVSGTFDDSRRPYLQPTKLLLHPPVDPVNFGFRAVLAAIGLLVLTFSVVLHLRKAPPWGAPKPA